MFYVLLSKFRPRDVLQEIFLFFFSYTYAHRTIFEKKEFSGVPSRGLKWESKTYKLKCSIVCGDWKKRNSSLLAPPLPPF